MVFRYPFLGIIIIFFIFLHQLYDFGAPDKPCGVGRADANPKLLLNDT